MALTGAAGGVALLARTAAGDMYPPERRARGIAYVLFGSVFGAILGPAVFAPLFAGKELEPEALTLPWLVAAGLALVACAISLFIRPDPKRIAEQLGAHDGAPPASAAPLSEILRRPGVVPAMIAAVASLAVMASVMNLTGYVVVEHNNHAQEDVFPIIGAHVFGMYALVLFVGPLIDRIGRGVSLYSGLVLMALSCIGLIWFESVLGTAVLLFGLGLGWNLSFVAATARLADRAAPGERGKLLGFSDLLSAMTAAALALLGGVALDVFGVPALAVGGTVLVLLPLVRLIRRGQPPATIAARRT
jgi:MFS family permease